MPARETGGRRPVVRMRDVAEAAGVSVKTVSCVVNSTGQVGAATRERVRAAIAELGYHPNPLARGLNARATGTVTLALPGLEHGYCAQLATEVFARAEAAGTAVVLEPTGGDRALERAVVRTRSGVSDGVLLMPAAPPPEPEPGGAPVVLLGAAAPGFDSVAPDGAAAAEAAVRLLAARGATRLAVLGPPDPARLAGCRSGLAAGGLPGPLLVPAEADSRGAGRAATAELLRSGAPFDALLALDDALGHGALHALRDAGTGVPGEVRVAAFGNAEDAEYAVPSLTTVRPDLRAMARQALDLLADRLRDGPGPARRRTTEIIMTERESTNSHQ